MFYPFYRILYEVGRKVFSERGLKLYLEITLVYVAVPGLMSLGSRKLQFGTALAILGAFSYMARREQRQDQNQEMRGETH